MSQVGSHALALVGGVAIGAVATGTWRLGQPASHAGASGSEAQSRTKPASGTEMAQPVRDPEALGPPGKASRARVPDGTTSAPPGGPEPGASQLLVSDSIDVNGLPLGPLFPMTEEFAKTYCFRRTPEWFRTRAGALVDLGRARYVSRAIKQRLSAWSAALGQSLYDGVRFKIEDIAREHAEKRYDILSEHVRVIGEFEKKGDPTAASERWFDTGTQLNDDRTVEARAYHDYLLEALPTSERNRVFKIKWSEGLSPIIADDN